MGPVFRALRERVDAPTQRFCDNCHQPLVGSSTGLSCETCHRAQGNAGISNARLLWDLSGPIRGPFANAQSNRGHQSTMHEFGSSADFCGTCHEVEGPFAFHETPYTEWRNSPAARQGDNCVSCHMGARPGMPLGPASMGAAASDPSAPSPTRALSEHRIVGPDDEQALATQLLVNSLSLTLIRNGSVSVLNVRNNNVGHAFPSGSRFTREAWIEWSVQSADLSWTIVSGALQANGAFVTNESVARVEFHDALSSPVATEATITAVRALGPGETREFRFAVPAGSVAVRARVRYRAQSFALLQALGVLHALPQPIEIASTEIPW